MAPEGADNGADFDVSSAFEAHLGVEREEEEAAEHAGHEEAAQEPATAREEPVEGSEEDPDVELPFGDEKRSFKLKELRELIEGRDAITSRSQAAQEAFQKAQQESERVSTAYSKLLERAQERYKPYADIDWLALSRDPGIDQDTFQQLRSDATAAYQDVRFLSEELDAASQTQRQELQAARTEAAKACIAELTDPAKGIKGFDKALYGKIVAYGQANGLKEVAGIVDAGAIKLLHKAMLFDQGQQANQVQVQKVAQRPSRVIRPGVTRPGDKSESMKQAVGNLRKSSSSDNITAAFLAHISGNQ